MTYGNYKYFANNGEIENELRCPGDYSEETKNTKNL